MKAGSCAYVRQKLKRIEFILAFSGGGQGFSWSWIKGRTRDEADLPRRFRAVPKLYIRGTQSQCPATYSRTPISVSGSVTISFTAWNSMITRFANEIGTILMIAPARRAPTLTLMISNTCYHLLVVVKGSSRLVMEFGNPPQGQGCSG